ncbi:hypothetical protein BOTBODRAFT_30395 [Botryobasidium botryosum FD-172 SS1]|uniref:Uncharacterized protein n=1 Tax=Botryobasidium botryosum (strain FD-172 SS1) TaxID=930990 RepID=A0A067MML5_BOTB1|nr:hypothetical protein BOTBODRAFT_30395 [Botryobasidium botryosum FD-172 SS1]
MWLGRSSGTLSVLSSTISQKTGSVEIQRWAVSILTEQRGLIKVQLQLRSKEIQRTWRQKSSCEIRWKILCPGSTGEHRVPMRADDVVCESWKEITRALPAFAGTA